MAKSSLRYMLHSGKNSKAGYFIGAGFRDLLPDGFYRRQLRLLLDKGHRLYGDEAERVDYYCRIASPTALGEGALPIGHLHRKDYRSTYYYDSRDLLRYFDPALLWCHLFGDVRDIPPVPTIVKSRSTLCDNSNAVLLKLNRCLHYVFVRDRLAWNEKKPLVLYRGHIGTRENRRLFCDMYAGHPRVDLADTKASYGNQTEYTKPKLSIYEQLHYRYIMSLEGNDVATNLKWIMGSHSVAVMPKPTCETWFMEGSLQPHVHYIEVRPDYADLMEKIDYYEAHPAEVQAIVANANRHVEQFRDAARERYIGLRVLEKYFSLTNPTFSLYPFRPSAL